MDGTTTLRDRAERAVAAAVAALPPTVQRLLAGGRPIRRDGQELAPDVQLVLTLLRLGGHRGLDSMTPAAARAEIRRAARVYLGTRLAIARVEPCTLRGPAGALPARLYVPDAATRGLVVWYHGGGWTVGDLDTHDGACRALAHGARTRILAVEYRLAPEHRFPAAADDALAAFEDAVREAPALGVDPARVAVGGDSAGGNLAAVVAQQAVRRGGPVPAAQLLVYPVTDLSRKHPSYAFFADGFFLTAKEMDWYRAHYLAGDEAAARDPRASPLLADDLRGLPPALVLTAGFDVLRDEGEAYARRMEASGVPVRLARHAGLVHGFWNAAAVSAGARAALEDAARWIAAVLA
jgi:acetyl esterase